MPLAEPPAEARRPRWLVPALGLALVAAGAGAYWGLQRTGNSSPTPPAVQPTTKTTSEQVTPPVAGQSPEAPEPAEPTPTEAEPAASQETPPAREPEPEPVRPTPARTAEAASPVPSGPAVRTGTMVWFGSLGPNAELVINGRDCSVGEVTRPLPGRPVDVRLTPSTLTVVELPSEANNWDTIRIRNAAKPLDTFVLTYTLR